MAFLGDSNLKPKPAPQKQSITNNLQAAMKFQSEEYSEVRDFLEQIKLEKYFDKMIDNGVEDLETILELQDQHIEQMGIPLGHKLKIIKKIKDVRSEKGMTMPPSREGTKREEISYGEVGSSKPATKIVYEELPMEKENQPVPGTQPQKSAKQVRFKEDSNVGMPALNEGQYNEAESHNSFLEALNAWRSAGQEKPKDGKVAKKDVEKAWEHQKDPNKKGSFFAGLEGNAFAMDKIPTWQEGGTMPDKKLSNKESCWQCYKLFQLTVETSEFKDGSRGFCSKGCYDKYNKVNMVTCPTCSKKIMKQDAHYQSGKWFYSEECANKDPEIVKIKEM